MPPVIASAVASAVGAYVAGGVVAAAKVFATSPVLGGLSRELPR